MLVGLPDPPTGLHYITEETPANFVQRRKTSPVTSYLFVEFIYCNIRTNFFFEIWDCHCQ